MNNADRDKIREQFGALLDGELLPEEREAVESALAQDSELLRELDALKRVDDLYRSMPAVSAPDGFEHGVRERLRPRVLWFGQRRHKTRRVWPTAVAAALFLLTSGYVIFLMQRSGSELRLASLSDAKEENVPKALKSETAAVSMRSRAPETAAESAPADENSKLQSLGYVGAAPEEAPRSAAEMPAPARRADEVETEAPAEGLRDERDKLSAAPMRVVGEKDMAEPDDAPRDAPRLERSDSTPATQRVSESPGGAMAQKALPPPAAPSPPTLGEEFSEESQSAASADAAAMEAGSEFDGKKAGDMIARGFGEKLGLSRQAAVGSIERREVSASKSIGPRTFVLFENTWYELGYAQEETVPVQRGSNEWKALVNSDKALKKAAELEGRVVFKSGDQWYALAAQADADPKP